MGGRRPPVDVFLLRAVVGRGRGDLAEIDELAHRLRRTDLRIASRSPWRAPSPRAPRALVVASQWGVTAARAHSGPLGAPGPLRPIVEELERAYGREYVVQVSLEEFARNLPERAAVREWFREGGVSEREVDARARRARRTGAITRFRREYRRFRGFGVPNLIVLFPTFVPSAAFAREFPDAVQCGPLAAARTHRFRPRHRARRTRPDVFWYASPGTSARLWERVGREPGIRWTIVGDGGRALGIPPSSGSARPQLSGRRWNDAWRRADLRIVTGSRTLLEALADGRPFLYFNGVVGRRRSRAHRPEKLRSLLELWRRAKISARLRRDLAEFARLQGARRILRQALSSSAWRKSWPARPIVGPWNSELRDAGRLIERLVRRWAASSEPAPSFAARERAALRALLSRNSNA